MAEYVNEEELKALLNNIKNLSNSFALKGRKGSGKHLLLNIINNKFFKEDYLDITDNINEECLNEIFLNNNKRLYVIDVSKITLKEQNILLKFIEEPYSNIYICLLIEDENNILNTVKNRLVIYELPSYKKDELKEFCIKEKIPLEDKYINYLIYTPGDILDINSKNIELNKIEELTLKIILKLKDASFPNTLSIIEKINFKDEFDKIDLDFLLRMLYLKYFEYFEKENNDIYFECLKIVSKYNRILNNNNVNKSKIFSLLLSELWEINHGIKRD